MHAGGKKQKVIQRRKTGTIQFTRNDILLILLILVFAFSVRYVTLMGQGITWDEPTYIGAGIAYTNNILHLNFDSIAWTDNMEHPPVSKYIYGAAVGLFNGGKYNYNAFVVAKMMSAIAGALTCVIVYIIGREFFSRSIALASAAMLALIPVFVAHTQMATIDGPVTLFFALTLYLFMMGIKKSSRNYYIASALSLAVLVDTKFTGLLAVPVMALCFIVYRHTTPHEKKEATLDGINYYLPVMPALGFLLLAAAVAFALYPWAWGGIDNMQQTLQHWSYSPEEYFLGSLSDSPMGYYPIYFMVTTPALLLIPLAIGIFYCLRSRDPYKYMVLLWLVVPFAYDLSGFKQDGMRYLLMIYPAVALLCGYGLKAAADVLGGLAKNVKVPNKADAVFAILGTLTVAYLIVTLASVSPYYLDYYNGFTGGPSNVYENKLFEFGWWGEGIYDSTTYLENTDPGRTVFMAVKSRQDISVYGGTEKYSYNSGENMSVPDSMNYFITDTYTERYTDISYNTTYFKLLHETDVQGAPLSKVYKKVA